MRILLAEDDLSIAAFTSYLLEGEGHTLTHAPTEQEARRLAASETWDLFLTDLFGPSFDRPDPGDLTFLRGLAARGPVIVITARSWARHASAADLGVAAILPKPYDLDELLALIRSV